MKRNILSYLAITIILIMSVSTMTVHGGVFKIVDKTGNWETIEDTFLKSSYEEGSARILLVADGYKLGGWFGSLDIDLTTEAGNNITGYIRIYIPSLNIDIVYYESYIPDSLGINNRISNKLIIKVGEDVKIYKDDGYGLFDSRLNTRIYFGIANVNNTLKIVVEDPYGRSGYPEKQVYYEKDLEYDGGPVDLYLEVYKNSGDRAGSIRCNLLVNEVEDGKVYDTIVLRTIDYGLNDLFYLSLDFLIVAIAFNLIAGRVRRMEESKLENIKRKSK